MSSSFPEAEVQAIERFIALQTRSETLPPEEVIKILSTRRRKFYFMGLINVFAVFFFSYSILTGVSQLPKWVLGLLGVTFLINLVVISRQIHWANRSIRYRSSQI